VASLVDTNILVYRFDPRYAAKQKIAIELLRRGLISGEVLLSHQAILELVAVVTRPRGDLDGKPLLPPAEAHAVAEQWVKQFPVLYPDEQVLTSALRAVAAYQLSWFDAHLWAYAEANGIPEILSEDFEHGRYYGSVRTVDPFLAASEEVHELPAMYDSKPPQSRR